MVHFGNSFEEMDTMEGTVAWERFCSSFPLHLYCPGPEIHLHLCPVPWKLSPPLKMEVGRKNFNFLNSLLEGVLSSLLQIR